MCSSSAPSCVGTDVFREHPFPSSSVSGRLTRSGAPTEAILCFLGVPVTGSRDMTISEIQP